MKEKLMEIRKSERELSVKKAGYRFVPNTCHWRRAWHLFKIAGYTQFYGKIDCVNGYFPLYCCVH